jgi:pimeloyl-ACP methyl ester carboxylesterase
MWVPLAKALMASRTVIVPDLRGMGLSSQPAGGYDKKTQGTDVARVLDALSIDKAALVTHDIGNMVGYAFAAQYPERVTRWVVMDAPLPGIGPWDEILKSPLLWHFNFRGPDMERLGRPRRIYLDRSGTSSQPIPRSEPAHNHYAALYARPGNMHCASNSSRPSPGMPSTTRPWRRRASLPCRYWRSAPTSPSARPRPRSSASSPATSPAW